MVHVIIVVYELLRGSCSRTTWYINRAGICQQICIQTFGMSFYRNILRLREAIIWSNTLIMPVKLSHTVPINWCSQLTLTDDRQFILSHFSPLPSPVYPINKTIHNVFDILQWTLRICFTDHLHNKFNGFVMSITRSSDLILMDAMHVGECSFILIASEYCNA